MRHVGWGWERGRVLALLALVVAALLAGHAVVPNAVGHLGSLLETFLPWLGAAIPALLVCALVRRSSVALLALLLPVVAWLGVVGVPGGIGGAAPRPGSAPDLVAVQHNVSDENPDPAGTARALAKVGPDLIAMQEVTPDALPAYASVLTAGYPHHAVYGTVALWSRHPLTGARWLDLRPDGIEAGWSRGLRATVRAPWGDIAVYVAHLPSVRLGPRSGFDTVRRDGSAALLGAALAAEPLDPVVLLGDLNSTLDDRGLHPVTSRMTSTGPGFAFSWPAVLPVARVDQIMARSATVTELWALPATGSDHLPVAARIRLPVHHA